jgi:TMEM175 potassium channel family protein
MADGDRLDPEPLGSNEPLALERIVFFSDAVMAIAITLLAIDLRLPAAGGIDTDTFVRQLIDMIPRYFAFAISFAVIGVYWVAHHRMFRFVVSWDRGLIMRNLLFLFFVVQLPFASSMLGGYGNVPLATAVYAVLLSLMGFASYALWMYGVRRRLVNDAVTPAFARYVALRALAVAIVFAVSVPIAFVSPLLAELSWLAISALLLVIRRAGPERFSSPAAESPTK